MKNRSFYIGAVVLAVLSSGCAPMAMVPTPAARPAAPAAVAPAAPTVSTTTVAAKVPKGTVTVTPGGVGADQCNLPFSAVENGTKVTRMYKLGRKKNDPTKLAVGEYKGGKIVMVRALPPEVPESKNCAATQLAMAAMSAESNRDFWADFGLNEQCADEMLRLLKQAASDLRKAASLQSV